MTSSQPIMRLERVVLNSGRRCSITFPPQKRPSVMVPLLRVWFGGIAQFHEGARDPLLRPIQAALPRGEAVIRCVDLIRDRSNWHVVGFDSIAGSLHAVHVSPFWRFVDDVKLRFE